MGKIQFDESRWPIVVVRYPSSLEARDWDDHLSRVIRYVERDRPWGMINDSRGAGHPNAAQRQGIVNLYDRHEELVRKNWRGTAIVCDSKITVGVLTALTWVRPPPHPFRPFSSYDEGTRWVESMFRPGELPADVSSVA
jgi:hypothetical protein